MFRDRADAGRRLAEKLGAYRGRNTIVLALPRGGVVLGYEVAHALHAPLDIVAPRKIGHPLSSEYAIGAVDENGMRVMNEEAARDVDPKWIEEEAQRQEEEAQRRISLYRDGRYGTKLAGKTVILVDDGIATGYSMRLAFKRVQAQGTKKIVVAIPVAPEEAVRELQREGAEVVLLEPPEEFSGSVGAHYARFEQVEDEEVIRLLQAHDNFMNT